MAGRHARFESDDGLQVKEMIMQRYRLVGGPAHGVIAEIPVDQKLCWRVIGKQDGHPLCALYRRSDDDIFYFMDRTLTIPQILEEIPEEERSSSSVTLHADPYDQHEF